MRKTELRFIQTEGLKESLSLPQFAQVAKDWLFDCEYRQHSPSTIATRRIVTDKLNWFLEQRECDQCSTSELRQFLAYLSRGYEDAAGLWGNARFNKPVRPRTVHSYYGHLRTFFAWLVTEGVLDVSPIDKLASPVTRSEPFQPLNYPQIESLLTAAKRSRNPRRNESIVMFLLDTGARASELCELIDEGR